MIKIADKKPRITGGKGQPLLLEFTPNALTKAEQAYAQKAFGTIEAVPIRRPVCRPDKHEGTGCPPVVRTPGGTKALTPARHENVCRLPYATDDDGIEQAAILIQGIFTDVYGLPGNFALEIEEP